MLLHRIYISIYGSDCRSIELPFLLLFIAYAGENEKTFGVKFKIKKNIFFSFLTVSYTSCRANHMLFFFLFWGKKKIFFSFIVFVLKYVWCSQYVVLKKIVFHFLLNRITWVYWFQFQIFQNMRFFENKIHFKLWQNFFCFYFWFANQNKLHLNFNLLIYHLY